MKNFLDFIFTKNIKKIHAYHLFIPMCISSLLDLPFGFFFLMHVSMHAYHSMLLLCVLSCQH